MNSSISPNVLALTPHIFITVASVQPASPLTLRDCGIVSNYPRLTYKFNYQILKNSRWLELKPEQRIHSLLQVMKKDGYAKIGSLINPTALIEQIEKSREIYDFIEKGSYSPDSGNGIQLNTNLGSEIFDILGLEVLRLNRPYGLIDLKNSYTTLEELLPRSLDNKHPNAYHEDGMGFHVIMALNINQPGTEFIHQNDRDAFMELAKKIFEGFKYKNQSLKKLGIDFDRHVLATDPFSLSQEAQRALNAFKFELKKKMDERISANPKIAVKNMHKVGNQVADIYIYPGTNINKLYLNGLPIKEIYPELKPLIHCTPHDKSPKLTGDNPRLLISIRYAN